ncbi:MULTISPECIES: AAA family ATPase [Flavobacteriaceae]|uniref:AAA family ATPase n=1 Tax=Flavobacteriaceae TaxID=49546 RepID=UPI0040485A92
MKISINNFKSIGSLIEYELKPLTILSGTNSSGKSSFIQLLLILKETIDLDSSKYQFYLKGDLFEVRDYTDILKGKDIANKLSFSFDLSKSEFFKYGTRVEKSLYDSFKDYNCQLKVDFDYFNQEVYISEFFINYSLPIEAKKNQFIRFNQDKISETFNIESNVDYFGKNVYLDKANITDISYSSIFPLSYDIYSEEVGLAHIEGESIIDRKKETIYPNIESIKSLIKIFFEEIHYIGPLREQPRDEYVSKKQLNSVGKKGENVAQILENFKDEILNIPIPIFKDDNISFESKEMSLIDGVKFWMCDVFEIGNDIYSKKVGDSYAIILKNSNGNETTIKHVGFGISQILPIIVEGLRMSNTGTLILEQPEIHLHPKLQSLLFDFLYSLTLSGKTIIIETHSDHLITRMRRRIAEEAENKMKDKINLTFIESSGQDVIFKQIPLDDYGTSDYFPSDFIDKTDVELRAIVKAQMKKRLKKN